MYFFASNIFLRNRNDNSQTLVILSHVMNNAKARVSKEALNFGGDNTYGYRVY